MSDVRRGTAFVVRRVLVATALLVATTGACSSSAGGESSSSGDSESTSTGSGVDCDKGGASGVCQPGVTQPYTSCADLSSPIVSFAHDVQPIFNKSCAVGGSACHGNPMVDPNSTGQIYLGSPGISASTILPSIVGKLSPENPQMNIVTAGDPNSSYLMHKLDGDQCLYASACTATHSPIWTNCGLQMPFQSGVLAPDARDTIRRWIKQGARGN